MSTALAATHSGNRTSETRAIMLGAALQPVHAVRIGTQSTDQKLVVDARVRRQNQGDAIKETTGESIRRRLVRIASEPGDRY